MPIHRCGKNGWKWGNSGKCYTGAGARARATRQARAIRASGWTGNVANPRIGRNPLRYDPSRTSIIRRAFEGEIRKRFAALKRKIAEFIALRDAFGLKPSTINPAFIGNFDPNEPRDEHGRWTSSGSMSILKQPTFETKFYGTVTKTTFSLSKSDIKRFPLGDKSEHASLVKQHGTLKYVKLSSLHATQETVSPKLVTQYSKENVASRHLPIVIEQHGKLYIAEGHHRLEGERLAGHSYAKVWVFKYKNGRMVLNYSPDEPRDERGRWTASGNAPIMEAKGQGHLNLTRPGYLFSDVEPVKPKATETPEFKRWFKASKVVDEHGEPLVVYHGTHHNFTKFHSGKVGVHFGTAEQANKILSLDYKGGYDKGTPNIKPVYLSIQNPLRTPDHVWDDARAASNYFGGKEGPFAGGVFGMQIEKDRLAIRQHFEHKLERFEGRDDETTKRIDHSMFRFVKKMLVKYGYDGTVYANQVEGHGDSYLAFYAHQIKSAIGNRGTFNPKSGIITHAVQNTEFAQLATHEQIEAFRAWLAEQIRLGIIDTTISPRSEAVWFERYIRMGFLRGFLRSFADVQGLPSDELDSITSTSQKKGGLFDRVGSESVKQVRDEFLQSILLPGGVEDARVRELSSRAATELKGATDSYEQKASRVVADGLSQGWTAKGIAQNLVKELDATEARAMTTARTEIVRSHAEGQLDALESLGVTQVGVQVEWTTAGDDKVCDECSDLEGVVLDIDDARGLIPRHPNCRCAFEPANVGEDTSGQIRNPADIRQAFKDSLTSEDPNSDATMAERRADSNWPGADKRIR